MKIQTYDVTEISCFNALSVFDIYEFVIPLRCGCCGSFSSSHITAKYRNRISVSHCLPVREDDYPIARVRIPAYVSKTTHWVFLG